MKEHILRNLHEEIYEEGIYGKKYTGKNINGYD